MALVQGLPDFIPTPAQPVAELPCSSFMTVLAGDKMNEKHIWAGEAAGCHPWIYHILSPASGLALPQGSSCPVVLEYSLRFY